jgi:phage-related tail fiber protein
VVDPSATSVLVREVYRANAVVTASADYPNAIELLLVLPLGVGGFAVREMSAIDENGDTLAIGNLAVMDVPLPGSGEVRECTFKMILVVSNLGSVVLTTDATLISASQKFVTTYVTTSINVHVATANPHPQYMLTTAANVAYSAVGHGHQIAQVAGLQSALDALATKIINTPTAVNLKRVDSKIYFIGQS